MDVTEAKNSPAQAGRRHPTPTPPPLPVWVPPAYAAMCGVGVALQAPGDAGPGLTAPLVGVALVLGAYALLRGVRARHGVPRCSRAPWTRAVAVAVVPVLHYRALNSTADLRWLYMALGVAVAGIVWYRLQVRPRQ